VVCRQGFYKESNERIHVPRNTQVHQSFLFAVASTASLAVSPSPLPFHTRASPPVKETADERPHPAVKQTLTRPQQNNRAGASRTAGLNKPYAPALCPAGPFPYGRGPYRRRLGLLGGRRAALVGVVRLVVRRLRLPVSAAQGGAPAAAAAGGSQGRGELQ
jgi:hypothetical protein